MAFDPQHRLAAWGVLIDSASALSPEALKRFPVLTLPIDATGEVDIAPVLKEAALALRAAAELAAAMTGTSPEAFLFDLRGVIKLAEHQS